MPTEKVDNIDKQISNVRDVGAETSNPRIKQSEPTPQSGTSENKTKKDSIRKKFEKTKPQIVVAPKEESILAIFI